MNESYRSKFENMVFNATADIKAPNSAMTGTSIYGWFRNHPTSVPSNPDIIPYDPSVLSTVREQENTVHHTPTFERKFEMERLFEVVVMYLFNGLKPSRTKDDSAYPGVDTTSLLHYLAYMIPEADKLHVVDLDTHSGYFERIENIRVIFDAEDYKFRVIVKEGGNGWLDISVALRIEFTSMLKTIVPHGKRNIKECWVEIATTFRECLTEMIQKHTKASKETVDTWILRPADIQWETAVYAAGDVPIRELLESGDGIKQFLVSYWSDNYLEFNGYKIARLFNGLVGYGEFLYDQDNNSSRKATNNFYIPDESGGKRWLWSDLPETEGGNICNTKARSNMLEAVIQEGQFAITDDFREMVKRRHEDAKYDGSSTAIDMLIPLILPGTTANEANTKSTRQALTQHIYDISVDLFHPPVPTIDDSAQAEDGILNEHIQADLTESFMQRCYSISLAESPEGSAFSAKTVVDDEVTAQVTRMVKIYIHTSRENWLLDEHTIQMTPDLLANVQQIYTSGFWNLPELDDGTWPDMVPGRAKAAFLESLNNTTVHNNSSLDRLYEDAATTTYGVGYMHAARKNNCACNPFECGFSAEILQGYYDRKVQERASDFIASCDLTSMLRSTQSLIRGLEKFMECGQSDSKESRHGGPFFVPPILKTTRSPFAAHGSYYVLEGKHGVYGTVHNRHAGNRVLHSDDIVTFSHTLFTIVDNPGIWNLLNTGTEKATSYTPQVANIGFVHNGTSIEDGSVQNKPTWKGLCYMTFTKLRVGVMAQPNVANTANRYVNEILNNTRRITGQSIQHAFQSFMFKIYNSTAFINSFYPTTENMIDEEVRYNNKQNKIHLCNFLDVEASYFVDRLHQCCTDSNLQVTSPGRSDYAFPALHAHGIRLPTDGVRNRKPGEKDESHHMQLFYIVFGETLCSIADDLYNTRVANFNVPQELQANTNKLLAKRLKRQIPNFLKHITRMFFQGELHNSLIHQLKKQASHKPGVETLGNIPDMRTPEIWTFEMARDNLTGALLHLRHAPVLITHEAHAWKDRPYSSEVIMKAAVKLLAPFSAVDHKIASDLKLKFSSEHVPGGEWDDESEDSVDERRNGPEKEEHIAKLTFQLYVNVYRKLNDYYEAGVINPPKELAGAANTQTDPSGISSTEQIFYENRMLAMRICEDQMHMVDRHKQMDGEYNNSRAWDLLLTMFMHQRQCFAELKL